jgi:mRNA interferase RelE/StbE
MTFEILWRAKALKDLRKLPKDISRRIVEKVDNAADQPGEYVEKLRHDQGYKLRVGDYRVILDIYEHDNLIVIRIVDHRKNVYKRVS